MKIPFGLLPTGELVDVSEVERGLACGCQCPGCRSLLVARKGDRNIHHFAHHATSACKEALAKAITLAVWQILTQSKAILLPPLVFRGKMVKPAKRLLFDEAIHQAQLLEGNLPCIAIKLDDKKLGILLGLGKQDTDQFETLVRAKQPAIQIDLSVMVRRYKKQESELTLAMLQAAILDQHVNKRWIFHSKLPDLLEQEQRAAEARYQEQIEAEKRQREEIARRDRENAMRPRRQPSPSQRWPPLHDNFIQISIQQMGGLSLSFPASMLPSMLIRAFGPDVQNPPRPEAWLLPFRDNDRAQIRALLVKLGIIRPLH